MTASGSATAAHAGTAGATGTAGANAAPRMPGVSGDLDAPTSAPPTARALFGPPVHVHDPGPMRPRAETLAGVGGELTPYQPPVVATPAASARPEVAAPDFVVPQLEEPTWAPPRAEPGDMGWDIVYGVKRSMTTNVQPRYNFESDDEPTSEIQLPEERRG